MTTLTLTPTSFACVALLDAAESASADGTLAPSTVCHVAEVWAALPDADRTRLLGDLDRLLLVTIDRSTIREVRALSTLRVAILATVR